MKTCSSTHRHTNTISTTALCDWKHLLHWHPTVTLILCLSVLSCPTRLRVMKVNISLCSKFKWWQDGIIDGWLIVDPIFHLSLRSLKLPRTRFVRRGLHISPQLSSSFPTISTAGEFLILTHYKISSKCFSHLKRHIKAHLRTMYVSFQL